MIKAVLIIIIVVLAIMFLSIKLSLVAYVAWMEENHFRQPTDKDVERLVGWCIQKYIEDLFGKS